MDLKLISTKRLLRMYRDLRSRLYKPTDDPERGSTPEEDQEEHADWVSLAAMKAELDTREHVVTTISRRKKQKRILKYGR